MRKILTIVRGDLRAVRRNVMTSVVVFGLIIIPMLFAVFNVLASWNPFGNTDQLKIAVASDDHGHESDIAPLRLNLGDQVLSQLSRNDQIDWVVTDKDDAVEGTKAGDYYASIVLPPDFSTSMLTFYVAGTEPTKLDMYTNEKKNALSTVITTQGADGMIDQINDTFTEIVSNVGLSVVSSLSDYLDRDDTKAAVDRIASRVENIGLQLRSGAQTVRSLGDLVESTRPLVTGAGELTRAAGAQFSDQDSDMGGGADSTADLDSTLRNATGALESALSSTRESYGAVADRVGDLFDRTGTTSESTAATFDDLAGRVQQQVDSFRSVRDTLGGTVAGALPDAAAPGYERVLDGVDAAIDRSSDLHDQLARTAGDIRAGNTSAQQARQRTEDLVGEATAAVDGAVTSYRQDLKPQLDQLGGTLGSLGDSVAGIKEDLEGIGSGIGGSPGSLQGTLDRTEAAVAGMADKLDEHAGRFDELHTALTTAGDTGDFAKLAQVVGDDPEALASQLAAPVSVDRDPVFPVVSFGAGMAPLYTALALWVGAVLTSVFVRPRVDGAADGPEAASAKKARKAKKAKNTGDDAAEAAETGEVAEPVVPLYSRTQAYFGRFGIFALIGLAQSTLVVLALIFFVEVRPAHPFLLLVCGWVTSLVFMLIVYTFVLSFGSAGKALSVLLLVMQVSGAGGAYPLPLLPGWFQALSPWLPATHAIDAMRAAIAGVYRGDLWIELGVLLLFAVPTLFLGLVLRRLLDGYNRSTTEAIESTKVMA
jgi:putative membrane protein